MADIRPWRMHGKIVLNGSLHATLHAKTLTEQVTSATLRLPMGKCRALDGSCFAVLMSHRVYCLPRKTTIKPHFAGRKSLL
jgi:hypothetical protein